eukprot:TRINITY_DN11662_c0_g1_i3.p1 TRINITY_DN11662_c0_g1~~TRINITY_DN11662_c0_g1_i3.p1  ORF type:complete len:110 (-),score=16.32 TRINITY_DN11662_c0_g1_i3:370-699(-)
MIRRPPRSTLSSSSAASDVYKRQAQQSGNGWRPGERMYITGPESTVLAQGPWRPSKLLAMSEDPRRKDKRPVWGKGEVITSAIRQQSFRVRAPQLASDSPTDTSEGQAD